MSPQTYHDEEWAALWVLWRFVEHTDFICRQCAMKFQNTVERKFLWSYWSCKEAGIKYKGILKG